MNLVYMEMEDVQDCDDSWYYSAAIKMSKKKVTGQLYPNFSQSIFGFISHHAYLLAKATQLSSVLYLEHYQAWRFFLIGPRSMENLQTKVPLPSWDIMILLKSSFIHFWQSYFYSKMSNTDGGKIPGFKKITLSCLCLQRFCVFTDSLHIYMHVLFTDVVLAYHEYCGHDYALCHLICFVKATVQTTTISWSTYQAFLQRA